VAALKALTPQPRIELLIPDLRGSRNALAVITAAQPDVTGHNLETVRRLFSVIRPEGDYNRSLHLLSMLKELAPHCLVKSGIMVGMGETEADIRDTLQEMHSHGVQIVTIGQYLAPTAQHYPVQRYYPPAEFADLQALALSIGFKGVAAAPLVRSSYRANELFDEVFRAVNENTDY